MRISLLVNTLNEEKNLEKNIKPLSGVFDEVVIIDMESSDNTVEIANTFADKVLLVPKMGYVEPARKLGVDSCSHDIIMILDADETISEPLKNFILDIRSGRTSFEDEVFYIPRKNKMMGKDIHYGQFKPDSDKQLRLFNRNSVVLSNVIHKGIKPKVETKNLLYKNGYFIYHFHSDSSIEFVSRLIRYCEIEGNNKIGEESFNVSGCIKSFVREYIKNCSFKNGRHGFALAFILSIRTFLNGK